MCVNRTRWRKKNSGQKDVFIVSYYHLLLQLMFASPPSSPEHTRLNNQAYLHLYNLFRLVDYEIFLSKTSFEHAVFYFRVSEMWGGSFCQNQHTPIITIGYIHCNHKFGGNISEWKKRKNNGWKKPRSFFWFLRHPFYLFYYYLLLYVRTPQKHG